MKKSFNNLKTYLITFSIIGSVLLVGFAYIKMEVQDSNFKELTSALNINFPTTYDQPLLVKLADFAISILPLGAQPAQAQTTGNVVKYIDAYQNTDVVQTKSFDKIKEDIILKQPGHPNMFQYQIDLSTYDFSKDKQGDFMFYQKGHKDDSEYLRFNIPAPFLLDANGKKSSTSEVESDLSQSGLLTIKPSLAWLSKAMYPVTLDPTVEISIINVHSHPQQGQNWTIDFNTRGTADLTITPNDQATISDDQFTSLSCDGDIVQPQILANNVIYYPNWSCDGTGEVVFYTKKAGNHTMQFNFGGQITYAYNTQSSIIFRTPPIVITTNIGTNSNTSGATVTLTGVTVPAGAMIFVVTDEYISSVGGTLADTVNTYTAGTAIANENNAGYGFGKYFYVLNCVALNNGTITYTKSTSGDTALISAFYVTGIATSSALDTAVTSTAYGSGTISLTSGTPAVAGELFVAFATSYDAYKNWFTQDTTHGWATPPTAVNSTSHHIDGGTQVNTGTGTKIFAPSGSDVNTHYAAWILGFEPASALSTLPPTPTIFRTPTIAVTNIGTNHDSSLNATLSITGVNVPAGAMIFVVVHEYLSTTMGTLADTVNTYTKGTVIIGGAAHNRGGGVYFFNLYCGALSNGTITYTKQSPNNSDSTTISAFYATGVATSNALDTAVTATTFGTSTANPLFTLTSGTPAVEGELFVTFLTNNNANETTWFSQDTGNGWAAPPTGVGDSSNTSEIEGGNQVNSSIGTKQFAPGHSGAANNYYAAWILGFKPALTSTPTIFRMLTRTFTCADKPATGTSWNTVSSYIQAWDGSSWTPADSTTAHNTTPDSTSCRYVCATNYAWNGSSCVSGALTIQTVTNMTQLDEMAPTSHSYGPNLLEIGGYSSSADRERVLGIFDFSALPAGATISSAILSLYFTNQLNASSTITVNRVRRVDSDITQATWNAYKTGSNWSTAGANSTTNDITTTGSATGTTPSSINNWGTVDITTMVQYAQTNTSNIIYLRTRGVEGSGDLFSDFYASAYTSNTTLRPKLVIIYTVP